MFVSDENRDIVTSLIPVTKQAQLLLKSLVSKTREKSAFVSRKSSLLEVTIRTDVTVI